MSKITEAMNATELKIWRQIIDYLNKDGFPTFAKYFKNFHLNLLTSKQAGQTFVAAVNADKAIIYVNPELSISSLSLVIRHEIAHHVFKHKEWMFYKLKQIGVENPSEFAYRFSNIVGDYHISNKIYDEVDKKLAKLIEVEGATVAGLVAELDFPENPEYWDMDFNKLWDELVKKYKYTKEDFEEKATNLSAEFIEAYNKIIDDFNDGKITKEDIEDYFNSRGDQNE